MIADIGAGGFALLLAHPPMAERVISDAARLQAQPPMLDMLRGDRSDHPYGYRVDSACALIPILGSLVPRGPVGTARIGMGVTSYEAIRDELRRATHDPEVETIIAMIDSQGGYVTGIDATSDAILAARQRKPVVAIVEGFACSAAYWLAAQCDAIIAAPYSELGSIGVLSIHVEVSKALEASGVKVTIIRAGARKAEGSPYEALSDQARADMQSSLDELRTAFVDAVVAGRAHRGVTREAIMATEATVFDAKRAVAMGLAERVGTLYRFLARMPAMGASFRRPVALGAAPELLGDLPGTTLIENPASLISAPPAAGPVTPPAAQDAPPPSTPSPSSRSAERERIGAIMSHEHARGAGRAVAEYFAYQTDAPAEVVLGYLDVDAEACRSASKTRRLTLDEEMAADITPVVGDGGPPPSTMTEMEKGAMTAASIFGKDPAAELQKLRSKR